MDQSTKSKPAAAAKKLTLGKEYWVQGRNAVLIEIQGTGQFADAVCRDRFDRTFTVNIGDVQEKSSYTRRYGKDGYFGLGGDPKPTKPRAKPVKKTNPARDNKPAPQPGRTFA